jgi:GrpB-like predicted nucleotidyltransferase (UPF0157 family)
VGVGDGLGLEKSEVALSAHNPDWIPLGQRECAIVRRLLGDLASDVVHVGSTSVPDLDAKPILDLVAAVPDASTIDEIVASLTGIGGYTYEGDRRDDGGLLFVRGAGNVRTVHVHIVGASSEAWRQYLRFHDLLLADRSARKRYQSAKRLLADQFPRNRERYTTAKSQVIGDLLASRPVPPPAR